MCSSAILRATVTAAVEIENCQEYLHRQVELIQPTVICTLGNFSTKLLRGDPTGITRLHGQPEMLTLGRRAVRLYPIFHPAAALYTPRMLKTLREDFTRLPELLALGAPEQPETLEMPELAAEGSGDQYPKGHRQRLRSGTRRSTNSVCSRRRLGPISPGKTDAFGRWISPGKRGFSGIVEIFE